MIRMKRESYLRERSHSGYIAAYESIKTAISFSCFG